MLSKFMVGKFKRLVRQFFHWWGTCPTYWRKRLPTVDCFCLTNVASVSCVARNAISPGLCLTK